LSQAGGFVSAAWTARGVRSMGRACVRLMSARVIITRYMLVFAGVSDGGGVLCIVYG
jgi:hypothetical protein